MAPTVAMLIHVVLLCCFDTCYKMQPTDLKKLYIKKILRQKLVKALVNRLVFTGHTLLLISPLRILKNLTQ